MILLLHLVFELIRKVALHKYSTSSCAIVFAAVLFSHTSTAKKILLAFTIVFEMMQNIFK